MVEPSWLVVALGSNIEPGRHLPAALGRLAGRLEVVRVSGVYESEPVGAPGTPRFWNAAALIRTELAPARVKLEILRPIEAELGRRRGSDPNAPRTIDLDLVLWSGGPVEDADSGLRLPDPGIASLAHLAVPIADVVPDWVDPESGLRLEALAERLAGQVDRVESA